VAASSATATEQSVANSVRFSRYLILVENFQIDPILKPFLGHFGDFVNPNIFQLFLFSHLPR